MRRTEEYILKVCKEFFNIENIIGIKEITGGHINETYEIEFKECRYVLQQLNGHVFYSPQGVMNNTRLILDHIRKKLIYNGHNSRNCLTLVKTKYDQDIAIVDDEYWRVTEYIENGISYEHIESPIHFYECGRGVGKFQNMLSDFHTRLLDDSIRHFHDTPWRYERFKEAIKVNKFDRVSNCKKEIRQIASYSKDFDIITSKIINGDIPRRVTHNDTKSSNIMLDKNTGKFLTIIDLDTVMKGSLLYDYGDALRFGASCAKEDETDLKKVGVNLKLVEAFTEGFLEELKPRENVDCYKPITPLEVLLFYQGFRIITIECAMRFLMDYIEGDHYFRIDKTRPEHNLERARNQLKLAKEIEKNEMKIKKIINKLLIKLHYDNSYLIKLDE